MKKEIGSEFHKMPMENGEGLSLPGGGVLVFSGRTAMETVLKQVPFAKKALLPAYCCDSMIQPFRDAGIEVSFYPVFFQDGLRINAAVPADTDIVLWCNYFGFRNSMPDFSDFLHRGGILIEDITHSAYSAEQYHPQSQYLVASVRKWEPLCSGGYCASMVGALDELPQTQPTDAFLHLKTAAMELKAEYLEDADEEKKTRFLPMFGDGNHWVAEHFRGRTIDAYSLAYLTHVDSEKHREKRIQNAKVLYRGLKNKVQFLFPESDMDCPLFVPVLLSNRDELRARLTANRIYCPVHWPKPEGCSSNLYDMELSLICDQRYNSDDMERIVSVLAANL